MNKVLIIILLLSSFSLLAKDCLVTRAAFDIGSGTTKLKVAQVNTCKKKIEKILLEANREVGYKQALKDSKNNKLNKLIVKKGIAMLKELKAQAQRFMPESYTAVATSAFRTAKNGKKVARKISKKLGFKINIISQQKEAEIGFVGASALTDKKLNEIVVWDIGGGSMQMTAYNNNGNYDIYKGKLAAVSFKNHVIYEVQNHNGEIPTTPNPITEEDKVLALKDARDYAKNTVPKSIMKKIKSEKTLVLGIGGVHYFSIGENVSETNTYSMDMILNHLNKSLYLTDEQLGGGKYVSTDITNLILVAGFMEELQINEVKTIKVNMADGLLINPSLSK